MAQFRKFKNTYDSSNCPVATIELSNFNVKAIIKQLDYDNLILENSTGYSTVQYLTNNNNKFEITHYLSNKIDGLDVQYLFTEHINDNNEPLFYKYELMFDSYGITENNNIQIYKNNIELIPNSEYNIVFSTETLYDNYIGANDPTKTRYGSNINWNGFDSKKVIHRAKLLLPKHFNKNVNDFYVVKYNKVYLNIQNPNHFELLELEQIYNETDFEIKYDSALKSDVVTIVSSKLDANSINTLYCIKDVYSHIKIDTISEVIADGSMTEGSYSWNVRISNGSFVHNDSILNTNTSMFKSEFTGKQRYQILSYIKPDILGMNIVQVTDSPIYINDFSYPDYKIDLLPNVTNSNQLPEGTIGVNLDNDLIPELKVIGIDRYKGILLFNNITNNARDMSLFYYTDLKYNMYIRNLELNPRLTSKYGLSSKSSKKQFTTIGIAIRQSKRANTHKEDTNPYFFNFDSDVNKQIDFYRSETSSTTTDATIVKGDLKWNPYNNNYDSVNGDFIPIGIISLNTLGFDIIDINDARRINGGLKDSYTPKLDNNQHNSYVDLGYYDGSVLPNDGLKIIHIPRVVYDDLVARWYNSDMFHKGLYTDVTEYELEQFEDSGNDKDLYYKNLLDGKASNTEDIVKDPYVIMKQKWAEYEASYYLNQLINKYLSAGSAYILLDENFKQIKLRLDM